MSEVRRPVIGITTSSVEASEPMPVLNFTMRSTYVDAIARAGGLPVVLPPMPEAAVQRQYLELCDGILFTGGPDLAPELYGEGDEVHPTVKPLHIRRQDSDLLLARTVTSEPKPFLAICLGCQEINVALGGSLIQDVPTALPDTPIEHRSTPGQPPPRHAASVIAGSLLERIVGKQSITVNTSHHQSVKQPGRGLRVVASAPDGVIEALELEGHPFGLALQWHPEWLTDEPEHLALFEALVKAAASARR